MSDETGERLTKLAASFRDAIERADRARLGITFERFPVGSCGDASPLLGHFLKEHGFRDVINVCGERGEVNVRESLWHDTFEIENEHDGDFTVFDGQTAANLARVYTVIMGAVE